MRRSRWPIAVLLYAVALHAAEPSRSLGLDLYRPVPENNPLSPEKIALGRRLFHERRLSRDGSLSCAACHDPRRAFTDQRDVARGVDGQLGHATCADPRQPRVGDEPVLGRPRGHARATGARADSQSTRARHDAGWRHRARPLSRLPRGISRSVRIGTHHLRCRSRPGGIRSHHRNGGRAVRSFRSRQSYRR